MAPIINVSKKVLKHIKGLSIPHELIKTPKPNNTSEPITINYQINPKDYIFLEAKNSGKDSYPDLLVCKYRLGASNAVESAGKQLGLSIKNTAKEKNKREYIGKINKKQSLKLNLILGGRTLNARVGKDFFALLLSEKAFDGKGRKIGKSELSQIADEIFGVRAPYRAEWFEDDFTGQQNNLPLNRNYVLQGDVLVPKYSHNLTTCLMKDRIPGIDLGNWLINSTLQGFPRKNTKSGSLWYWHPRPDKAARFDADPGDAVFSCNGNPQDTNARLGVRHVREARNFSKK